MESYIKLSEYRKIKHLLNNLSSSDKDRETLLKLTKQYLQASFIEDCIDNGDFTKLFDYLNANVAWRVADIIKAELIEEFPDILDSLVNIDNAGYKYIPKSYFYDILYIVDEIRLPREVDLILSKQFYNNLNGMTPFVNKVIVPGKIKAVDTGSFKSVQEVVFEDMSYAEFIRMIRNQPWWSPQLFGNDKAWCKELFESKCKIRFKDKVEIVCPAT